MPLDTLPGLSWTREHDKKGQPLVPSVPLTCYPKSLEELIELCRDPSMGPRLHAVGSHWALSDAAISDSTFIETHDPNGVKQVMGKTLTDVVPGCLSREYLDWMHETTTSGKEPHYLVHVEAGKRIYQLYAELDQPIDPNDKSTLAWHMRTKYKNSQFDGPWAFATLGGAGGQTVVGAMSTGTHGGDHDRPPLADSVRAIHLVGDGGRHFWIEPSPGETAPVLTDDTLLKAHFEAPQFGDPPNFEIIREDSVFNAVLVSVGRFGVIYSVVLRAVPQHNLYEQRRQYLWQDIKNDIKNLDSWLYTAPRLPPVGGFAPSSNPINKPRFLQIVVLLTPVRNFQSNIVGVTKRWSMALPPSPLGREQRVGAQLPFDPRIQAPLFANAGSNHPHSFDPDKPYQSTDPGLFEVACQNSSFMAGLIGGVVDELEEFIDSEGAVVGGTLATILVPGAGGALLLIHALRAILVLLKELLEHFDDSSTVGSTMDWIRKNILEAGSPGTHEAAAGALVWQMIAVRLFEELQGPSDFEGISYAMMDRKDYRQRSCEVNVDSLEVFFDATDDRLIAFIDALINFERSQEYGGKAFFGYASLRFTGPSRATLGEQKWNPTCSVEVAGLRDTAGSQELVNFAMAFALNPNINGLLHWGQRNDYSELHVKYRYGAHLIAWQKALARITDSGTKNRFSNAFTRRTGLEP